MSPPTATIETAGGNRPVRAVDTFNTDAIERVRTFLEFCNTNNYQGWDHGVLTQHLQLISASNSPAGSTTFELVVTDRFSNRLGTLHGGATATLFDICTTTALVPIAKVGFWQYAGITRSLNVSYMRPVSIGSTVRVVSTVAHAGKRLASIRGELRDEQGRLLAFCEHLKATNDPPAEKL